MATNPMLLRLVFSSNLLFLPLLFVFITPMCVGCNAIENHYAIEMSNRRELQEQRSSLKIVHEGIFTYLGDILSSSDRSPNTSVLIDAMVLSLDERTVYYVEKTETMVNSTRSQTSVVKKAERLLNLSQGVDYNISYVAGPWLNATNNKSTIVQGLLMLDSVHLIISDKLNSLLRRFDVTQGKQVGSREMLFPLQMAKHPTQEAFFVSSSDRIIKVPLTRPEEWNEFIVISGPADLQKGDFVDSQNKSEVRFCAPHIGPQAVSQDGGLMYVADYWNNAVRQVDLLRGATDTISASGPKNTGLIPEGGFQNPNGVVLTADGCNLFVSDRNSGRIHWLKFDKPGGNVTELKTVAVLLKPNGSPELITSPCLSKDEQYLFFGSGDGQILKLQLNITAVHGCAMAPPPGGKTRTSHGDNLGLVLQISLGVLGFLIGALACTFCVCFCFRRHSRLTVRQKDRTRNTSTNTPQGTGSSDQKSLSTSTSSHGLSTHKFSESSSESATNVIREFPLSVVQAAVEKGTCLTGKGGGYGDVYRASLEVGRKTVDVAIKVMRGELNEIKHRQFRAELNALSNVRHKNLCKLLGFCAEEGKCILVYPFIEGGSLHDRLHDHRRQPKPSSDEQGKETSDERLPPPDWQERMLIAKQIATCLRYLHSELEQPIVHRDVKCRNILVQGRGKSVQAFLCDFGLAKPRTEDEYDGHTFTGNTTVDTLTTAGTPGYMPPEYIFESRLTMSSDVFAFGVVLLELVTGQLPISRLEDGSVVLLSRCARQSAADTLIDSSIQSSLTPSEGKMASDVMKLGLQCTDELARKRPSMKDVVFELEVIMKSH
ncbi:hypothetical protein CBR_g23851 [Chara braunii]|uniref:Protein kinase domain-containing protein n=1 Tax=Chara braunii TaxID=69332 RepID=A0A388L5D2_CHABU|nr:hypothetical protein CBR_g23851 [Chara braunii]|eukprot:GBG77403.1 hypothetical protein CBR_g23851 [Chara braunii]